jgi:ferredoxin--NADP+ reductase
VTARAAVVGAGPSGFYAADQLLREGFAVDLFDALPTPFGLVRAGVAPDHP